MSIFTKMVGEKRRWREYKARTRRLPENYRTAVDGIERYLMHFGPADGDSAAAMFEDLADLFEQAAADQTPIREIVGDDPVEFVTEFVQNYMQGGGWIAREQGRLNDAIARAAGEETGTESSSNGDDTRSDEGTQKGER